MLGVVEDVRHGRMRLPGMVAIDNLGNLTRAPRSGRAWRGRARPLPTEPDVHNDA